MVISQDDLKVLNKTLPAAGIKCTAMSDSWGLGETDLTPIANKIAAQGQGGQAGRHHPGAATRSTSTR